jgi:hypothetical protein
LDMPLSLRASYCFSFLTFDFLFGTSASSVVQGPVSPREESKTRAQA